MNAGKLLEEEKQIASEEFLKHKLLEKSAYAGVEVAEKGIYVSVKADEFSDAVFVKLNNLSFEDEVVSWFHDYAVKNHLKFVSVGVVGFMSYLEGLVSKLWLKEDIVSYIYKEIGGHDPKVRTWNLAVDVQKKFDPQDNVIIKTKDDNEVLVSDLTCLEFYKKDCRHEDFYRLLEYAKRFEGKKLVFFNSTAAGGGVALMRHALVRLLRQLNVDVRWYISSGKKEVFEITKKKFHNILQAVAPDGLELTQEDIFIYEQWSKENAKRFEKVFASADVVVIDDPQPSGLIKWMKRINPSIKIIYRSHIQLESHLMAKKDTAQYKTWNYISHNIRECDLFVSHPIRKFIPGNINKAMTVLMPATTDSLDGLNKELSQRQMMYYLKMFNRSLLDMGQEPLHTHRKYIVQVARFDPSKGIPDVIESFYLLRGKLAKYGIEMPQLVIVGHGSVDDPEGVFLFNKTMELLKEDRYAGLAADVKVARLPHCDQILDALLRGAYAALQLSHKEGFEVKVTEALHKGVPVVAYKAGGIPLQIEDRVTGFLVPVGKVSEVASRLYELFVDARKRGKMSKNAREKVNKDYFTVSNALCWLYLANELVSSGKIVGNGGYVMDMVHGSESNESIFRKVSRVRSHGGVVGRSIISTVDAPVFFGLEEKEAVPVVKSD